MHEGHRDDATLRAAVVALAGATKQAALAGGVDDASLWQHRTLAEQLRLRPPVDRCEMARREVTFEVHIDHGVPLRFVHREHHGVAQEAGVVDQDVQVAKRRDGTLNERFGIGPAACAAAVGNSATTSSHDGGGHDVGAIGDVVDHNRCAFGGKKLSMATAYALPGSSDDGNLAGECTHDLSPSHRRIDCARSTNLCSAMSTK